MGHTKKILKKNNIRFAIFSTFIKAMVKSFISVKQLKKRSNSNHGNAAKLCATACLDFFDIIEINRLFLFFSPLLGRSTLFNVGLKQRIVLHVP